MLGRAAPSKRWPLQHIVLLKDISPALRHHQYTDYISDIVITLHYLALQLSSEAGVSPAEATAANTNVS